MKDRETPCLYYICKGECTKGRNAEYKGYCQHCDKYKPRIREKHVNGKKVYLDKIKKTERWDA